MLRKSILMLSAVVAVQLAVPNWARAAGENGPPMNLMLDGEAYQANGSAEEALLLGEDATPKGASRGLASADRKIAREDKGDSDDDEFNFSWLDPDKKVYVLQNRKYRKKNRFAIFLSAGLNLSNPYRTEYEIVPRAAFWFSEQFGVEFFYSGIKNSDNTNLTALKNASPSALPFVRENDSYYGAVLTWTPWYSKLNFFNKILYYDWYFDLGGGQTATAFDQNRRAGNSPNFIYESLFTVFYGTGMQFYVSRNFMVRLDMLGMMYSATGADGVTKSNTQNYDFTAGIGWAF